ncbi:MAG TPA: AraC family transcriptional regulator [Terrimicrobiaceae bacterium]|nr:AraC family transcriptional regulator [Terrimicrobiaceae bacterium]
MSRLPAILEDPLIESLPEARQSGLRLKSFRKDCVDFHWHFHPEIELIHVKTGSGVRYVGRAMGPFASGDLCLIGANVPHAFGSHPAERRGAEWTVGHFLPEIWGTAFWQLPEMKRVAGMLVRARRGLRFDPAETDDAVPLFERMESVSGASRLAAWLEILERLARARGRCLNPSAFTEVAADGRLQRVLAWIEDHAADAAMTQARAAGEIRMSPQAFCRFFRKGTGRPFHRYVSEVRVARACGALLHGDAGISEIAFQAGFNNLANFNRRFREITGRTPREYRRMRGGLGD